MVRKRPISKAEVMAYGRLLEGAKARPQVGDSCLLPDGRRVAIMDTINHQLCRVRFESGHMATVSIDLLSEAM